MKAKTTTAEDIGFSVKFKTNLNKYVTLYAGGRENSNTIALIADGKIAETTTKVGGKATRKAVIEGGKVIWSEVLKNNGDTPFTQLMDLCCDFAAKMGYRSFKVTSGDGKGCNGYPSPAAPKAGLQVTHVSTYPANGKALALANVCLSGELWLNGIEVRKSRTGMLHIEFPGKGKGINRRYQYFPAMVSGGSLYNAIQDAVLAQHAKMHL